MYPAPSKYVIPSEITHLGTAVTVNEALELLTVPVGVATVQPEPPPNSLILWSKSK